MSATITEPLYYETTSFARSLDVSSAAVDKWVRLGLLKPLRTKRGTRLFTAADREAILRLRAARAAATGRGPTPGVAA